MGDLTSFQYMHIVKKGEKMLWSIGKHLPTLLLSVGVFVLLTAGGSGYKTEIFGCLHLGKGPEERRNEIQFRGGTCLELVWVLGKLSTSFIVFMLYLLSV